MLEKILSSWSSGGSDIKADRSTILIRPFTLVFLLFVLINFHLIRNLNSALFIFFVSTLYSVVAFSFVRKKLPFIKANSLYLSYLIFLLFGFYVAFISMFSLEPKDFWHGLARFFVLMPLGLISFANINTEGQVRKILIFYVAFVALASATVPLQHIIGPISWFSGVYERAGIPRFSSLMGSVTVTGIAGGAALTVLLLLSNVNRLLRYFLICLLLGAMIFSLQKASLANICLAFGIYIWISGRFSARKLFRSLGTLSVASLFLLVLVTQSEVANKYVGGFLVENFGLAINSEREIFRDYYDYTFVESLEQRLLSLPGRVLATYGPQILLIGGGMKVMAGTLGQDGPMNHNGYFDVWFSGGIVYFILFIVMVALMFRGIRRAIRASEHTFNSRMRNNLYCIYGVLIVILVNNIGANTLFQPNTGALFWLLVGVLAGHYNKEVFVRSRVGGLTQARMQDIVNGSDQKAPRSGAVVY